ncbi:hypothetical protein [Streptomyces sp. NPDC051569]|uniref:hypothetical protein n=1 Tax=Streptomyces sp. NPDC051569 TaxID=3365661 RepID=UPI003788F6DB
MSVMRRALLVAVSAATAVVMAAGPGAGAEAGSAGGRGGDPGPGGAPGAAPAPASIAPEADLAHHGHASLWSGELTMRLGSENHGPSPLPDATVRIEFSVRLVADQALPSNCLWGGERIVLCRTGQLRAVGRSREIALGLRTVGTPDEVVVRIDTAWNGGASDRNLENHQHRVLVPATGDLYAF